MNHVYLLIDSDKNVVAIYDSHDLAQKMKEALEKTRNLRLTVEKRTVNQDLKTIGVVR